MANVDVASMVPFKLTPAVSWELPWYSVIMLEQYTLWTKVRGPNGPEWHNIDDMTIWFVPDEEDSNVVRSLWIPTHPLWGKFVLRWPGNADMGISSHDEPIGGQALEPSLAEQHKPIVAIPDFYLGILPIGTVIHWKGISSLWAAWADHSMKKTHADLWQCTTQGMPPSRAFPAFASEVVLPSGFHITKGAVLPKGFAAKYLIGSKITIGTWLFVKHEAGWRGAPLDGSTTEYRLEGDDFFDNRLVTSVEQVSVEAARTQNEIERMKDLQKSAEVIVEDTKVLEALIDRVESSICVAPTLKALKPVSVRKRMPYPGEHPIQEKGAPHDGFLFRNSVGNISAIEAVEPYVHPRNRKPEIEDVCGDLLADDE